MARTLEDPRYARLIEAIKRRRKEAGMTQEQVASIIGKPQSFIAKVEGLERKLDVIEFLDICRAVGIRYQDAISKIG